MHDIKRYHSSVTAIATMAVHSDKHTCYSIHTGAMLNPRFVWCTESLHHYHVLHLHHTGTAM